MDTRLYQPRGMAVTSSMLITISTTQFQSWTVVSPLLGIISVVWPSRPVDVNFRRTSTVEAGVWQRQLQYHNCDRDSICTFCLREKVHLQVDQSGKAISRVIPSFYNTFFPSTVTTATCFHGNKYSQFSLVWAGLPWDAHQTDRNTLLWSTLDIS